MQRVKTGGKKRTAKGERGRGRSRFSGESEPEQGPGIEKIKQRGGGGRRAWDSSAAAKKGVSGGKIIGGHTSNTWTKLLEGSRRKCRQKKNQNSALQGDGAGRARDSKSPNTTVGSKFGGWIYGAI